MHHFGWTLLILNKSDSWLQKYTLFYCIWRKIDPHGFHKDTPVKGQRELKIVGKKRLKLMLSSWSMFKYKGKNTVKVKESKKIHEANN